MELSENAKIVIYELVAKIKTAEERAIFFNNIFDKHHFCYSNTVNSINDIYNEFFTFEEIGKVFSKIINYNSSAEYIILTVDNSREPTSIEVFETTVELPLYVSMPEKELLDYLEEYKDFINQQKISYINNRGGLNFYD